MGDVGGVSGSRQRSFSDEEVEAMRRDESSSAIVNKARRDAGFKEKDVAVRGDDRTLDEVLHDRHSHVAVGEGIAGAIHGFEVVEAVGVASHSLHALGRLPHVVLPAALLVSAHIGMYELEKDKEAMKDGATRDQLHAAILFRLDVPQGFRDDEMKRLGVSVTAQSAAYRTSTHLDAHTATLQLHCDQGMHAARTMIESGKDKDGFLAANPAIAKRYAEDAAFHNGFDALAWARSDKAPRGTYDAQVTNLETRDARYDAAHVSYRM